MTNLQVFNQATANTLFNSTEQFPINFDDAWRWLEYDKKGNAKVYLKANLIADIDFLINQELGSLAVPRPAEKIFLSVEGFKNWAMLSNTEVGRKVRKYFLECERVAKQKAQTQLPQTYIQALEALVASEKAKEKLSTQLVEAQPKIDFCDRVEASPELCTMGDYLKSCGWGRTLGFKELRELGIIQKQSNLPYQHWIKAGYFTVHTNILGIQSARVTGRGQVWLSAQLSIPTEPEIIQKKRGKDKESYLAARCELELKGSKVTQRAIAGVLNLTEQSVRNNTVVLFGSWENFLNDDFDN